MLSIAFVVQYQNENLTCLWIDDPIFGNAGLCIFPTLVNEIALGIIRTDNFDNQICSRPIRLLITWIIFVGQKKKIGFAILSVP